MYIKHFGLKKLPFENVPDPLFFFDQGDHARIHNRIKDSLRAGRGLMVVTGPIGSGKTTLSQMIISEFSNDLRLIWIAEPPGTSIDLFLFIAQELGLKPSTSERTFVLRDIRDALLKINSEGSKCLVIMDESHLMSDDIVNGVRLLNNLEEGSSKLIQVLMLGQEELIGIINRPDMEPFKQRIATLEIIGKMNADRIREYIIHRIQVARGQPSIFSDTGWEAVDLAFGSEGTPRIVNTLCDRSLHAAFERKKSTVDIDDVYEAAEGMGISKEIFHHKVALKQKEREKPVPAAGENNFIKEPKTNGNGITHSIGKDASRPDKEDKNILSETALLTRIESGIGLFISKIDMEGLKKPLLFLLSSVAALILSIFFYCQRSVSPGSMTCILELIGF
jgi:general secretion pathway protein A